MHARFVFLLAMLAATTAGAQGLDKFYIGAFWVGGNAIDGDTIRQPNPGPVQLYNENPMLSSNLPQSRFDELEDLGLNLAAIELDPDYIVRTDPYGNRNVLRDITDDLVSNFTTPGGSATDIDVCVFDSKIQIASQLNRVILNPESGWDFENRAIDSSTNIISFLPFSSFPFQNLKTDRSILEQGQLPNCVRFTSPSDTISVLRFDRKRELTAKKCFFGDDEMKPDSSLTENLIAGLYHVSVILADDDEDYVFNPPPSSSPVLTVRIWSTDPADTSKRVFRDLVVPGSAFYDGPSDPSLRAEPFEFHLGAIEVRIDSFYTRTVDTTEDAWRGCKLTVNDPVSQMHWERTDVLTAYPLRYWEDLIFRNWMGNFEIQIFANSNVHFLVDAVCLSSPAAYGLFAPNDAHAGEHSGMYDSVMIRMSSILSDRNGVGSSPTRRIPLLSIKEQSPRGGGWPSTRMLGSVLTDSLPSCRPYAAHGAQVSSEDFGPLLEFHRDIVSGFYTYSIDYNYPRMCENPDATEYYDSLYQNYSMPQARAGRMRDNIFWYRNYAQNRAQREINSPWIPFVQNHSNLFSRDIDSTGAWWDFDNLREPSAAELRLMSNIALGHGADGIMFYQYNTHGTTRIAADSACWPRLRSNWVLDSLRPVNLNAGSMGFLGANNLPRVCDWNGENKWDSTKSFISGFLRPIGEFIRDLEWKRSKSWQCNEGESNLVAKVLSQRQDEPVPIDPSYATFVETAEFEKNGIDYLFVINGRSHKEGQRHVTVKLAGIGGDDSEYKVTRILGEDETGDIWIVRPSAAPDSISTANGFTDYFEPGAAALYRLEAIEDETLDFPGDCLGGSLYVEPAAALNLDAQDVLKFLQGNGCYVDGSLDAQGTTFQPCNIEQYWDGIYARNGGDITLEDCSITGASVVAGSSARVKMEDCSMTNTTYAICNLNAKFTSWATTATACLYGYAWNTGTKMYLWRDEGEADFASPVWSTGVYQLGPGYVDISRCRINDFGTGIMATEGVVTTDSVYRTAMGRNVIDAKYNVLLTDASGMVDFGDVADMYGKNSCFYLQDYTNGYHAWGGGLGTYADSCYWEPQPPKFTGTVSAPNQQQICSVPFTGGGTGLFSKTANPPPPRTRFQELVTAFRNNDVNRLRNLVSIVMQRIAAGTVDERALNFTRFVVLDMPGYSDLRDTLVTALLVHPDTRLKLLASDLLAEEERFDDALQILHAYSFEGSPVLKREQLIRHAYYKPRSYRGGYGDGLRALDTLASLVGNDSTWKPLFTLYPKLFSGLTLAPDDSTIPKASKHISLWDRIIPEGIEIGQNYPNPFRDVTSFTFKLGKAMHVRLTIHDAMGREVAVLADADYTRGVHSVVLRNTHLPSGLYFCRFMSDEGVIQRKMMLVR